MDDHDSNDVRYSSHKLMLLMDRGAITIMVSEFAKKPNNMLTLVQWVEVCLYALNFPEEDELEITEALCQLFTDADVFQRGMITWSEITDYLIMNARHAGSDEVLASIISDSHQVDDFFNLNGKTQENLRNTSTNRKKPIGHLHIFDINAHVDKVSMDEACRRFANLAFHHPTVSSTVFEGSKALNQSSKPHQSEEEPSSNTYGAISGLSSVTSNNAANSATTTAINWTPWPWFGPVHSNEAPTQTSSVFRYELDVSRFDRAEHTGYRSTALSYLTNIDKFASAEPYLSGIRIMSRSFASEGVLPLPSGKTGWVQSLAWRPSTLTVGSVTYAHTKVSSTGFEFLPSNGHTAAFSGSGESKNSGGEGGTRRARYNLQQSSSSSPPNERMPQNFPRCHLTFWSGVRMSEDEEGLVTPITSVVSLPYSNLKATKQREPRQIFWSEVAEKWLVTDNMNSVHSLTELISSSSDLSLLDHPNSKIVGSDSNQDEGINGDKCMRFTACNTNFKSTLPSSLSLVSEPYRSWDVTYTGHEDEVLDLTDARPLRSILTCAKDSLVALWDPAVPAHPVNRIFCPGMALSTISFQPLLKFIYASGMNTNKILQLDPRLAGKRAMVATLHGHAHPLRKVLTIPYSWSLISEDVSGCLRFWDSRQSKCYQVLEGGSLGGLSFSTSTTCFAPSTRNAHSVTESIDYNDLYSEATANSRMRKYLPAPDIVFSSCRIGAIVALPPRTMEGSNRLSMSCVAAVVNLNDLRVYVASKKIVRAYCLRDGHQMRSYVIEDIWRETDDNSLTNDKKRSKSNNKNKKVDPDQTLSGNSSSLDSLIDASIGTGSESIISFNSEMDGNTANGTNTHSSRDFSITCLSLTGDGRRLIIGTEQGEIGVHICASGQVTCRIALGVCINALTYLHKLQEVVASTGDGSLRFFSDEAATARLLPIKSVPAPRQVSSLSVSQSSNLVALSSPVSVWIPPANLNSQPVCVSFEVNFKKNLTKSPSPLIPNSTSEASIGAASPHLQLPTSTVSIHPSVSSASYQTNQKSMSLPQSNKLDNFRSLSLDKKLRLLSDVSIPGCSDTMALRFRDHILEEAISTGQITSMFEASTSISSLCLADPFPTLFTADTDKNIYTWDIFIPTASMTTGIIQTHNGDSHIVDKPSFRVRIRKHPSEMTHFTDPDFITKCRLEHTDIIDRISYPQCIPLCNVDNSHLLTAIPPSLETDFTPPDKPDIPNHILDMLPEEESHHHPFEAILPLVNAEYGFSHFTVCPAHIFYKPHVELGPREDSLTIEELAEFKRLKNIESEAEQQRQDLDPLSNHARANIPSAWLRSNDNGLMIGSSDINSSGGKIGPNGSVFLSNMPSNESGDQSPDKSFGQIPFINIDGDLCGVVDAFRQWRAKSIIDSQLMVSADVLHEEESNFLKQRKKNLQQVQQDLISQKLTEISQELEQIRLEAQRKKNQARETRRLRRLKALSGGAGTAHLDTDSNFGGEDDDDDDGEESQKSSVYQSALQGLSLGSDSEFDNSMIQKKITEEVSNAIKEIMTELPPIPERSKNLPQSWSQIDSKISELRNKFVPPFRRLESNTFNSNPIYNITSSPNANASSENVAVLTPNVENDSRLNLESNPVGISNSNSPNAENQKNSSSANSGAAGTSSNSKPRIFSKKGSLAGSKEQERQFAKSHCDTSYRGLLILVDTSSCVIRIVDVTSVVRSSARSVTRQAALRVQQQQQQLAGVNSTNFGISSGIGGNAISNTATNIQQHSSTLTNNNLSTNFLQATSDRACRAFDQIKSSNSSTNILSGTQHKKKLPQHLLDGRPKQNFQPLNAIQSGHMRGFLPEGKLKKLTHSLSTPNLVASHLNQSNTMNHVSRNLNFTSMELTLPHLTVVNKVSDTNSDTMICEAAPTNNSNSKLVDNPMNTQINTQSENIFQKGNVFSPPRSLKHQLTKSSTATLNITNVANNVHQTDDSNNHISTINMNLNNSIHFQQHLDVFSPSNNFPSSKTSAPSTPNHAHTASLNHPTSSTTTSSNFGVKEIWCPTLTVFRAFDSGEISTINVIENPFPNYLPPSSAYKLRPSNNKNEENDSSPDNPSWIGPLILVSTRQSNSLKIFNLRGHLLGILDVVLGDPIYWLGSSRSQTTNNSSQAISIPGNNTHESLNKSIAHSSMNASRLIGLWSSNYQAIRVLQFLHGGEDNYKRRLESLRKLRRSNKEDLRQKRLQESESYKRGLSFALLLDDEESNKLNKTVVESGSSDKNQRSLDRTTGIGKESAASAAVASLSEVKSFADLLKEKYAKCYEKVYFEIPPAFASKKSGFSSGVDWINRPPDPVEDLGIDTIVEPQPVYKEKIIQLAKKLDKVDVKSLTVPAATKPASPPFQAVKYSPPSPSTNEIRSLHDKHDHRIQMNNDTSQELLPTSTSHARVHMGIKPRKTPAGPSTTEFTDVSRLVDAVEEDMTAHIKDVAIGPSPTSLQGLYSAALKLPNNKGGISTTPGGVTLYLPALNQSEVLPDELTDEAAAATKKRALMMFTVSSPSLENDLSTGSNLHSRNKQKTKIEIDDEKTLLMPNPRLLTPGELIKRSVMKPDERIALRRSIESNGDSTSSDTSKSKELNVSGNEGLSSDVSATTAEYNRLNKRLNQRVLTTQIHVWDPKAYLSSHPLQIHSSNSSNRTEDISTHAPISQVPGLPIRPTNRDTSSNMHSHRSAIASRMGSRPGTRAIASRLFNDNEYRTPKKNENSHQLMGTSGVSNDDDGNEEETEEKNEENFDLNYIQPTHLKTMSTPNLNKNHHRSSIQAQSLAGQEEHQQMPSKPTRPIQTSKSNVKLPVLTPISSSRVLRQHLKKFYDENTEGDAHAGPLVRLASMEQENKLKLKEKFSLVRPGDRLPTQMTFGASSNILKAAFDRITMDPTLTKQERHMLRSSTSKSLLGCSFVVDDQQRVKDGKIKKSEHEERIYLIKNHNALLKEKKMSNSGNVENPTKN